MPTCTVTLSANAGLSITLGGQRIWVDAVHRSRTEGFSTLSKALWDEMKTGKAFSAPRVIAFTHCHPDHFSETLTAEAQELWPEARLILPEQRFPEQTLITGEEQTITDGALEIRFLRVPHDGTQYALVPHYAIVITDGAFTMLAGGDCAPAHPRLAQRLENTKVDLAIMGFPWLALPNGRAYLRERIAPAHLFVCHLPFARDDTCGYRRLAAEAAAEYGGTADVRLLQDPFQTETVEYRWPCQ